MNFRETIAQKRKAAEKYYNVDGRPTAVEKLDPNASTLSITVQNTNTDSAKTARIFGAIGTATAVNNAANDIVVTPANATHQELLDTILADPFRIKGMKYQTTLSTAQFANSIKVVEEDAFGKKTETTIHPLTYKSNKDYNGYLVEARDFSMKVQKTSYLEVSVNAGETLTFIFNISDMLSRGNELSGRATLKSEDPYKAL